MDRKVRLYQYSDADLIALAKNPYFSFPQAVLKALTFLAYDEDKRIALPKPVEITDLPKKYASIIEIRDPKVDELIDKVKKGTRNGFMKSVLRSYLVGPYLYPHLPVEMADKNFESKDFEIINCYKTKKQAEAEIDKELMDIKKMMGKMGKTAQEVMDMLEKSKKEALEKTIKESEEKLKPEEGAIMPVGEIEETDEMPFAGFGGFGG